MSPTSFKVFVAIAIELNPVMAQQNMGPLVLLVPIAIFIAFAGAVIFLVATLISVLRSWRQFATPIGHKRRGRWFRATFWLWIGLPFFVGLDAIRISIEDSLNNPAAIERREKQRRDANSRRYERDFYAHRQRLVAEAKRGSVIDDHQLMEYYGGDRWYGGWLKELTATLGKSDPRLQEFALATFPTLVAKSRSDRLPNAETRAAIDELRRYAADAKHPAEFCEQAISAATLLERKITPGANILLAAEVVTRVTQEFPTPVYDELVLEAEREFQHQLGKTEDGGWSATPGEDQEGHLIYGPYLEDLPPGGIHVASFRLLTSAADYGSSVIVALDVYDALANKVLASQLLTMDDFRAPMEYQDFPLPFFCGKKHKLEFRVWWHGGTYVRVDRVGIHPPSVTLSGPWQLQVFDHPRNFSAPSASDWAALTQIKPVAAIQIRDLGVVCNQGNFNDFVTVATGKTELPAGNYRVWTLADQGVRIAVDGNQVIDRWHASWPHNSILASAAISLDAGEHTIRAEHFPDAYAFALYVWIERDVETAPP